MRKIGIPLILFLFLASLASAADTSVRILPHRWSLNSKSKGRVKAEIRHVDPKSIDTSTILMNGVAPLKSRTGHTKIIAFFSKRDVLGTLGSLQAGQIVTISVTFNLTNAPASFSDDVKIVAGKKKQPPAPPVTPGKP